jgi:hypothetical protein
MAPTSIIKVIRVLPEAVTVLKKIVATEERSRAVETTRNTGIPSFTKESPCPNKERNEPGNKFKIPTMNSAKDKLIESIFLIR